MTDRIRYFQEPRHQPRLLSYAPNLAAAAPRQLAYRVEQLPATRPLHPYVRIVLQGLAGDLDPIQATETILALLALGLPLLLEISAEQDAIELGIICHVDHLERVSRALRGVLPQVDLLTPEQYPCPPDNAICYSCVVDAPNRRDIAPLRDVGSYHSDPLQSVLEALLPLRADESVRIHYAIALPNAERWDRTQKELYFKLNPFLAFFMGVSSGPYPRFEPAVQKQLEERLTFPVAVTIKVALVGTDRARLQDRARSLYSVFGSRFTTGAEGIYLEPWYWTVPELLPTPPLDQEQQGLLLNMGELAACWHLPSSAVNAPGVSFLKRPLTTLPQALRNRSGLLLGLHHQRSEDVEARALLDDVRKSPMILIVGKTGMGKSELNKQIVTQLDQQPGLNPSCLVLDPNYDLARDLTSLTPPHLRDQTFLLDHGDINFPPGCPLMTPPSGVAPERFIEQTYTLFRSLFAENWSESRMADLIYALIVTLVSTPDATLWHAPKVLSDPSYRRGAVARLKDPVAIDYWREFEQLSPGAKREVIRPVTARLRRLLRVKAVRNIVCRTDGPDLGQLLNNGARVYLSTAGPDIRSVSDLLLEIYLIKAHLSLEARLSSDGPRHPTVICVDESPRFTGPTLPILLREGRKMGLTALTISTQYIKAWGESLSDAVLGNVASLIAFQCGADDASKLSSMIKPFSPDELQNLDIHEAIVRLSAGGSTFPAFDIKTLRVETEPDWETFEYIKENTRRLFSKPKAEIEQSFEPDQDEPGEQDGDWLLDE